MSASPKLVSENPRPVREAAPGLVSAELLAICDDGLLSVRLPGGLCEEVAWLESAANAGLALQPGDRLLIAAGGPHAPSIALGRIGRYQAPAPVANLVIEATERLSLRCGESSVDLRADGKLMVRGEDVLLRATGTQRIRAGHVAIN